MSKGKIGIEEGGLAEVINLKAAPNHPCTNLAYYLDRCDCCDQSNQSGFRVCNSERNRCLAHSNE